VRTFDPASFYARVGAGPKERNVLRHDLVRGLKDYYERVYGYDKYGAETAFYIEDRMGQPFIYGFALLRILHDRRVSSNTKRRAVDQSLEMAEYGTDFGVPFALIAALQFLARHGWLEPKALRYGLLLTAGEYQPFHGLEKPVFLDFFHHLLEYPSLPAVERAFWGHSLVARHQDEGGIGDLVDALLGCEAIPRELRIELSQAWVNARQPRLEVEIPAPDGTEWGDFIVQHMPFWVAHVPSWPGTHMVRLGLVWLARLGGDPLGLITTHIQTGGSFDEQLHAAVADIIAEHHAALPQEEVRRVIEQGLAITGSSPTRRRFYRLGADLFGPEYLERAAHDTAGSVRQWAAKQQAATRA
jgi:hypothetical protein